MTQDKVLRNLLDRLDRVSLSWIAASAALTVAGFGLLYWIGTAHGWGLRMKDQSHVSLPNALYFSVTTFTSLGYGDILPTGISKLMSCIEVICGLAFFGVGVAKLSSFKQSYLIGQLYARDVQFRLDQHAASFRRLRNECKHAAAALRRNRLPLQSPSALVEACKIELSRARGYVSFESRHGYMLENTPAGSITRLLKSITASVTKMSEMVCIRQSQGSQRIRRKTLDTIILAREIATYCKNSADESIGVEVSKLEIKCNTSTAAVQAFLDNVEQLLAESERQKRLARGL